MDINLVNLLFREIEDLSDSAFLELCADAETNSLGTSDVFNSLINNEVLDYQESTTNLATCVSKLVSRMETERLKKIAGNNIEDYTSRLGLGITDSKDVSKKILEVIIHKNLSDSEKLDLISKIVNPF